MNGNSPVFYGTPRHFGPLRAALKEVEEEKVVDAQEDLEKEEERLIGGGRGGVGRERGRGGVGGAALSQISNLEEPLQKKASSCAVKQTS